MNEKLKYELKLDFPSNPKYQIHKSVKVKWSLPIYGEKEAHA